MVRLIARMKVLFRNRSVIIVFIAMLVAVFIGPFVSLPKTLFTYPYSAVVNDSDGGLLGAKIANDGQWRFPPVDSVPDKFRTCITYFEDEYFEWHPGVNPMSILRAIWQNVRANKIVSGGSTLTMQTVRLWRRKERSVWEKVKEMLLATSLEFTYSKNAILAMYASHAPFGGNVVGLGAASWRYYGVSPEQLTWSEMATLAVLPNQPSLIFPGRNQELLSAKRNRLLKKLLANKVFDSLTYELALLEPLPQKPKGLPAIASHLVIKTDRKDGNNRVIHSTIQRSFQREVDRILEKHHQLNVGNSIHNGAVLVANMSNGQVLAYVGNTKAGLEHSKDVNIIEAQRSTGSLLKPFLYASALDDALILPQSLLPDIPTFIGGFVPKNFNKTFDGAVPADEALTRSLNIPFVHLLRDYSYQKFHSQLRKIGFSNLRKSGSHYGLSLILGGAEFSLWDLTQCFLQFGQQGLGRSKLNMLSLSRDATVERKDVFPISKEAAFITLKALLGVNRPGDEVSWERYGNSQQIAWKTGTSFGFKDAWAIGFSGGYVVGVWVGNASGEGRAGLTGVRKAAPIMFEVFDILPKTKSFMPPSQNLKEITVCNSSGYKASRECENTKINFLLPSAVRTSTCPFHQHIYIDDTGQRISSTCATMAGKVPVSQFILPPNQAYYYKRRHANYNELPQWSSDCRKLREDTPPMDLIYPRRDAVVFIPKELAGRKGKVVLELAHTSTDKKVYWQLDEFFLGTTERYHKLEIEANKGLHRLYIVDEDGYEITRDFTVTSD